MAQTPADKLDTALNRLTDAVDDGDVDPEDADAIRTLVSAYNERDATVPKPKDLYGDDRPDGFKKAGTLAAWTDRLTVVAHDLTLTDTDAAAINALTTALLNDDDGPGRSYIQGLERTLSKFYRFHDDLGVDHADIVVHPYETSDGDWRARDLLTPEERAALRAVADHPRDVAIYHLLLYCGLRNTALRTLRVGDIDLSNHEYYFNADADGLKDIHEPREPRALNQAVKAVRDWLDYHPAGDDPDAYLITAKPNWTRVDPYTTVSSKTIERCMKRLKERTAERDDVVTVTKPVYPHFLRHNFVSMARANPEISDADIKFQLGHKPGSDVMETTYSHLSADDHNSSFHAAMGVAAAREGAEREPAPWDTTCSHCDAVLAPGDAECDCGTPRGSTPWADPADADAREQDMDAMAGMFEQMLADRYGVDPDDLADALAG